MESLITKGVMARVNRIHRMRAIAASPVPKMLVTLLLLGVVSSTVSYADVLKNMPNIAHLQQFFVFVGVAFAKTELSVQIVSIISTALMLFAVRDFFVQMPMRNLRSNQF